MLVVSRDISIPLAAPHRKQRRTKSTFRKVKCVAEAEADGQEDDFHLLTVGTSSSPPIAVDLLMNSKPLRMEPDTGAAVSINSESTGKAYLPTLQWCFP